MVLVIVRLGGPEWNATLDNTQNDQETMTLLRSNIRRICKLGNEMEFHGHFDAESASNNSTANNINMDEAPNTATKTPSTDWHTWDKFTVDYYLPTSHSPQINLRVCEVLKWDATKCQAVRAKYFVSLPKKQQTNRRTNKSTNERDVSEATSKEQFSSKNDKKQSSSRHHGGGIGKRKQGEIVADFLLWILSTMYHDDESKIVPATETETKCEQSVNNNDELVQSTGYTLQRENDQHYLFMERWVPLHPSLASSEKQSSVATRNEMVAQMMKHSQKILNRANNADIEYDKSHNNNGQVSNKDSDKTPPPIIDAAGGAGHVSLALALRGVHSTVVDPRSAIGKLPGRDRKVLKKSKQEPFSTYRAWFGTRPKGVDTFFREGCSSSPNASDGHESNQTFANMNGSTLNDPTTLPICSMCSDDNLLPNCLAVVALHPDEATGPIVEIAVENGIPFLVIPCCVFSRLFPERMKPQVEDRSGSAGGSNTIVSTYYDLIDWLVAKHPAIKVTRLPFEGANIAVWATFK